MILKMGRTILLTMHLLIDGISETFRAAFMAALLDSGLGPMYAK